MQTDTQTDRLYIQQIHRQTDYMNKRQIKHTTDIQTDYTYNRYCIQTDRLYEHHIQADYMYNRYTDKQII